MAEHGILIAPNQTQWDRAGDEFAGLEARLRALGFEASIQAPRNGNFSLGGVVINEAVGITVFVWERVRDDGVDMIAGAIVAEAARWVHRRGVGPAKDGDREEAVAEIVGPRGETLRRVPLTVGRREKLRRSIRARASRFRRR